jgi:hypothetical protein
LWRRRRRWERIREGAGNSSPNHVQDIHGWRGWRRWLRRVRMGEVVHAMRIGRKVVQQFVEVEDDDEGHGQDDTQGAEDSGLARRVAQPHHDDRCLAGVGLALPLLVAVIAVAEPSGLLFQVVQQHLHVLRRSWKVVRRRELFEPLLLGAGATAAALGVGRWSRSLVRV